MLLLVEREVSCFFYSVGTKIYVNTYIKKSHRGRPSNPPRYAIQINNPNSKLYTIVFVRFFSTSGNKQAPLVKKSPSHVHAISWGDAGLVCICSKNARRGGGRVCGRRRGECALVCVRVCIAYKRKNTVLPRRVPYGSVRGNIVNAFSGEGNRSS